LVPPEVKLKAKVPEEVSRAAPVSTRTLAGLKTVRPTLVPDAGEGVTDPFTKTV
jgi:hypothetical protein